mgnify:FL=1
MFEEMVVNKEKQLREENLKDLRDNLNDTDVQFKIANYAEKYGFETEVIKERIKSDDLVASFFVKDPSKQNFTEKLVAELLNTKTLPQSGKNCIRFNSDGDICSTKGANTSKSADFLIGSTYITQKYTRSAGGAQDNQYADVVDFLSKGSKKHNVAAIVDGSYWDNSKRQELKNFFNDNTNVQVLSMDDILTGGINPE